MRRGVLLVLLLLALAGSASAAQHPRFSLYSAPEGVSLVDGVLTVNDTAVFRTGKYSINDTGWVDFSFGGDDFAGSDAWVDGAARFGLPPFGVGEHYVIVYSCSYAAAWDCHGTWQLLVVNNTPEAPMSSTLYVDARGDALDDVLPHMVVLVDGVVIDDVLVSVAGDALTFAVPAGSSEASFTFDNDAYGGPGRDVNLYISRVALGEAEADLPSCSCTTCTMYGDEIYFHTDGTAKCTFTHDAPPGDPVIEGPLVADVVGVRASASQDGDHLPGLTLDGVLSDDSYWSAEGDGQWVEYELSRVADVSFVEVAFPYESSRVFEIETSLDGVAWNSTMGEVNSAPGSPHVWQRFTFNATEARYVRFLGHGSSASGRDGWNAVSEMNINDFSVDVQMPVCAPEPLSVTCADACGPRVDGCGDPVDCGECSPAGGIEVIYFNSFEQDPIGSISSATKLQDWTYCSSNVNARIQQYPDDAANPSKVFMNKFLNGTFGSSNGFRCYYDFEGRDEVYLSFKVKFGSGLDPVLGGKFPRLFAGSGSAGYCPDGYDEFTGGMMFKNDGGLPAPVFYLYYPEQWNTTYYREKFYDAVSPHRYPASCDEVVDVLGGCYGETLSWGVRLQTGRWYTITERIVANTPGQDDGLAEGFIDGVLVYRVTGMHYRDTADLQVDHLEFSSFFGGSDTSWAVKKDEYLYYDDVIAYRYLPGSGQPLGLTPSQPGRVLPPVDFPDVSPVRN